MYVWKFDKLIIVTDSKFNALFSFAPKDMTVFMHDNLVIGSLMFFLIICVNRKTYLLSF